MKVAYRSCSSCHRVTLTSVPLCVQCWDHRSFTPPAEEPLSAHLARVVALSLLIMLGIVLLREHSRPEPAPGFQPSWPAAERPGAIVVAAEPPRRGKR